MTPGSSKKDTDLFLISEMQLDEIERLFSLPEHAMDDIDYAIEKELPKQIRSRPYNEQEIRQAAINGVLDDFQEYFENDPPIDNGAHTFRRIMNKIAEHRQQQQEEEGGGQR